MGVSGTHVGILGGAFDPPHDGHLAIARGAIVRFGLDQLLVRVVGTAPVGEELEEALRAAGVRRGAEVEIGEEVFEWE